MSALALVLRVLPSVLAACLSLGAQTVALEQGYISKNLAPGATAHIWAQQNTPTRVFAGWAGDTQYLLDSAAPYTTFTVPNANVNLRATYRTVPAWTPSTATINNIPVTYYIPPDPLGLVFAFHPTGTGAVQFTSTETLSLVRDLVAAGFGVAAFDSFNRSLTNTSGWNTAIAGHTNPDVVRLNGVIAAMRAQSLISSQLPLFAVGPSNGGLFAHLSPPQAPTPGPWPGRSPRMTTSRGRPHRKRQFPAQLRAPRQSRHPRPPHHHRRHASLP